MSIISLLVVLMVFGVVVYCIRLIPMDATVQKIITAVAILALVLWLLDALFGLGAMPGLRFGRVR